MRPRGTPPMPRAASRATEPVGMASTSRLGPPSPKRMMAPLPKRFSISEVVASIALSRSSPYFFSLTSRVLPFDLAITPLSFLFDGLSLPEHSFVVNPQSKKLS